MNRLSLLLLLSTAAYAQGVPAAPRAPAFNPVTDSPVPTGQPGYVVPARMPRSPHGRVLPETPETRKEPGIWAAKEADEDTPLYIKHWNAIDDYLKESDLLEGRDPVRICAELLKQRISAMSLLLKDDPPVTPAFRKCLVARLIAYCTKAMDADPRSSSLNIQHLTPAARALSEGRTTSLCAGGGTKATDEVYFPLRDGWDVLGGVR